MFNRRKRSYRKGPPANQIYVPHDQRKLTNDPIPIMTEQQAQYYLKQLKDMGYIPSTVDNYKPQVIQIRQIVDNRFVSFSIASETDKYIPSGESNISSADCDAYDIQGNLLDKTKYDITNILDQNGYKLYPLVMDTALTVYNGRQDAAVLMTGYYITGSSTNISIPAATNYRIYENSPTFTKAFPNREGDQLILYAYSNIYESTTPIFFKCPVAHCYLRCYYLTCIVVKVE